MVVPFDGCNFGRFCEELPHPSWTPDDRRLRIGTAQDVSPEEKRSAIDSHEAEAEQDPEQEERVGGVTNERRSKTTIEKCQQSRQ